MKGSKSSAPKPTIVTVEPSTRGDGRRVAIVKEVKLEQPSVASSHGLEVNERQDFFLTDKTLNFPQGLQLRTVTPSSSHNKTVDHIEDRLKGLPGSLKLDLSTSHKYFGDGARNQFFERHQWLNRQRCNTTTTVDEELTKLYFDNEKQAESAHVAFGPIRRQQSDLNIVNDNEEHSITSKSTFASRFKPRSEASYQNETVMLQESAERSGDLLHLRDMDVEEDDGDHFVSLHELSEFSEGGSPHARSKPPMNFSNKSSSGAAAWSSSSQQTKSGNGKILTHNKSANLNNNNGHPNREATSSPTQGIAVSGSKSDKGGVHEEEVSAPAATETKPQPAASRTVRSSFLALSPTNDQQVLTSATGRIKPGQQRPSSAAVMSLSKSVSLPATSNTNSNSNGKNNTTDNKAEKIDKNTLPAVKKLPPAPSPVHVSPAARPKTAGPNREKPPKPNQKLSRSAQAASNLANKTAGKGANGGGVDIFSSMLLENLLAKKNVKYIAADDKDDSLHRSLHDSQHSGHDGDDDSIASESTVSTIGMYIATAHDSNLKLSLNPKYSRASARSNTEWGRRNLLNGGRNSSSSNKKTDLLKHNSSFNSMYSYDEEAESGRADISRGTIRSPRSKYIAGCMAQRLNPRASLVVRKNMSKQLNLQHHGMGDTMAKLLAESIQGLPFVESINIADNMLTDDGMGPIIMAAVGIVTLIELNLSQNEIGPVSAKALFDYLISPTCPLERLILNNADVDDFECARFIEAIKQNSSLKELDLSNNKIGSAENLNTVMPDLITGGEAIAELLRLPECNLTSLKLDWNLIRLDGAIDLARSIAINRTLIYLDLSFNSLGTDGGVTLGVSILKNTTLETLILTSNSLDSIACFTICAGVIENRGLKRVVLDGNPIGEQGMKALMLVPMIAGNRVKISAARCNVSIRDSKCWFDFVKLIRDYELKMEDGFHRAIAIVLLHLIAGHHSYIFSDFVHVTAGKGKAPPKQRNVDLMQVASTERSEYFDAKQRKVLRSLNKVKEAASDIQMAITLFQETDEDGSGELDKQELGNLMSRMGLQMSDKRLTEVMNQFDVDQGGRIEIHEFLMLLKAQHQEAIARIKELVEAPVMALKSDKKTRYLPPDHGTLRITVKDGFARKDMYRIMSSCDKDYIDEVAKDIGGGSNATSMISSSLQGTKLRLDEGLSVAQSMLQDSPDKVAVIKKMISQMNDSDDCRNLITSIIEGDRVEMMRLKRDMGAALRPILGQPNGYYILDLAKPMDRMCLEKLLEISATTAVQRSTKSKIGYGRVGDLSQKGNWSSFRNETWNGEPVTICPAFATPIPLYGKLEFDFSGGGRPTRDALVLSDVRIVKLLISNFILDPTECAVAIYKLSVNADLGDKTLGCNGNNYFECSMDRARLIGEHVEQFYLNFALRVRQFEESLEKESSILVDPVTGNLLDLFERDKHPIPQLSDFMYRSEMQAAAAAAAKLAAPVKKYTSSKAALPSMAANTQQSTAARRGGESSSSDSDSDSSSDSDEDDDEDDEMGQNSHSLVSNTLKNTNNGDDDEGDDASAPLNEESMTWQQEFQMMKEAAEKKARDAAPKKPSHNPRRQNIATKKNFLNIANPDEFLEKFENLLQSQAVHIGAKAHRIIDMLEDLFSRSWIFSRHLALIVECFAKFGYVKQTKYFGTYRVDLVIALFARVVDLHNFEFVMEILSPFEAACVYCRLGWLNIYNPCKPEGSWELDMSRREERVVAKTLCCLATNEPGDNWIFNTFRWMRSMESMPGWELTQPWLTEEGMPMRGLLNITYYSGEGKGKKGCKPYVSFRKALLNLVLINEEEVVSDGMRGRPPPAVSAGDRAFQKHSGLWESYLAPENVDPNRKR